jgi:branched-chain amino acid aminotransferase
MSTHSFIVNAKNESILININGKFFKRNEAKISVFDSGFLLGDGVWEGIRLHQSVLVHIEEHLNRLYESAEGIALHINLQKEDIINEINKTLAKNNMKDNVHIRLVISRGDKITPYQNPNANVGPINFVIIPEYKKANPDTYKNGIKIGRVKNIRPTNEILNPQYNTLSKLNCILASIEANKLGYDEGIMNDIHGFISTCNSTNLFFIKNAEIITSTGQYCLNGITRLKTIEICKKNHISCHEKNFTFEDISDCEEAFVTGTFGGIIPVSTLEDKSLQSTNKESITNKIRTLYLQEIENYIKSKS